MKAGGDSSINNGTFTIDSADDVVHSNSNVALTDGEFNIKTGDDGSMRIPWWRYPVERVAVEKEDHKL
ncbi:carbohydrate-binding domain-containing protein [Paenibacillus sp. FSL R10-2734]|uniref:carbohydrate-binding domain-containing protein n=1 Tax=Paenibacillus sp. FSL R10-2734 TaxID=2954691 RepID=UPI0030DCDA59